jgi:hypothetical protein
MQVVLRPSLLTARQSLMYTAVLPVPHRPLMTALPKCHTQPHPSRSDSGRSCNFHAQLSERLDHVAHVEIEFIQEIQRLALRKDDFFGLMQTAG